MSSDLPDTVDVWRMVQARRSFAGQLPLTRFKRLAGSLADFVGTVRFDLDFDRDAFGSAYLRLRVDTALPLLCQRTLDVYSQAIVLDQRLGLIRKESDEAALLPDYEPLLVSPDGQLDLVDVIEDELILALPLVPTSPGAPLDHIESVDDEDMQDEPRENPFAMLAGLKKH